MQSLFETLLLVLGINYSSHHMPDIVYRIDNSSNHDYLFMNAVKGRHGSCAMNDPS